jgi:hypothetical protein
MRFSRTYRAVLVFLFVGFLGVAGPALDGRQESIVPPPTFEAWLDGPSQSFIIEATDGMPGAPGLFNILVVAGPNPGLVQIQFTYDAIGSMRVTVPISQLRNGWDLIIGMNLVSVGIDGGIHESPVYALATHNYVVTDPTVPPCTGCPTAPGGFLEFIDWPGTTGNPIYPHSGIAINTDDARGGSQPMLALESGPAGSFPIN